MHPFTCPALNHHEGHPSTLIATQDGWVCPSCDYTQVWAHDFMLNWPLPVFVFGSNLAGRHGAGAALFARQNRGAQYGVGVGRTGNAYAIPTKDERLVTLALPQILPHVETFLEYAKSRLYDWKSGQHEQFQVTAIGCGYAGYTPAEIAPMFEKAPPNCMLPKEFELILAGAPRAE